jgi:hypothetical protein
MDIFGYNGIFTKVSEITLYFMLIVSVLTFWGIVVYFIYDGCKELLHRYKIKWYSNKNTPPSCSCGFNQIKIDDNYCGGCGRKIYQ